MRIEIHIVPEQPGPIRLQEYGVGIFNTIPTKSALKKALKKGYITINDLPVKTATLVQGGEIIKLVLPEKSAVKKKLVFPLKVLFEDEHMALVHKPAGILVSGNHFKTIANALASNLAYSRLPDATSPQPVHRLDYGTTGILLIGKTSGSIRSLNKLFENKTVEKRYYAITIGTMPTTGVITSEITGKASRSTYTCIATVASKRFGSLNLVELQPHTGKRHQLRIHLSRIGNPILGDKTYGNEPLILTGQGLYLHAYSLKFTPSFHNKQIYFRADFPSRFTKIFPKEIALIQDVTI